MCCLRLTASALLSTIAAAAIAQEGPSQSGIGYPTVAAALEALRASPDAKFSVQGGWTIVDDRATGSIWSFTPPDHPAYPAAVKRTVVQRNGKAYVDMQALCQASKAACDKLIVEFRDMNEKAAQAVRRGAQSQWRPTREQEELVERQTLAYFSAKDSGKYQEAYSLFSPSQRQMISLERWISLAQQFNSRAGPVKSRKIKKVTWYKDPPNAAPGIYAAVDFAGEFANIDVHCGFVAWKMQEDGSFLVVREEENFIDKAAQQKLKEGELDKLRSQFGAGCR